MAPPTSVVVVILSDVNLVVIVVKFVNFIIKINLQVGEWRVGGNCVAYFDIP